MCKAHTNLHMDICYEMTRSSVPFSKLLPINKESEIMVSSERDGKVISPCESRNVSIQRDLAIPSPPRDLFSRYLTNPAASQGRVWAASQLTTSSRVIRVKVCGSNVSESCPQKERVTRKKGGGGVKLLTKSGGMLYEVRLIG